jgi:hypothetical protein
MCGKTRWYRIRNDEIKERVGVAPIVEMIFDSRLRWFEHVERMHVDYVVRKIDHMEGIHITRGKGRFRKTIRETMRNDPEIYGLQKEIVSYKTI